MSIIEKFLSLLFTLLTNPKILVVKTMRPLFFLPFTLRLKFDAVSRPHYAYCLFQAAKEAKALGINRISAIEFGVAGGQGIMAMEKLSSEIEKITKVKIDIYGFDLERGLPKPKDFRDLPYVWKSGFYKMNYKKLSECLTKAKLILGDVKETTPKFIKKNIAPIGFIAFDLDYYSSTREAFKIFDANREKLLPRVFCYFDDTIGPDEELHSSYTGELLAIKEFNRKNKSKKICKINGLIYKRKVPKGWNEQVYILHLFNHPLYTEYIYPGNDRQLII
ncbi:MAG: hypothetical protein ACOX5S_00810 [Patescibacteria group bacterium]|jgi:hypothetical protein